MIAADFNCIGNHGIGRFAREVFSRIEFAPIKVRANPNSPAYGYHLAVAISKSNADAFFSPSYVSPLWSHVPFVFTIHDLNHIDRPENSSALKRLYYKLFLKSGCRRAAKVLTVSEFSRGRILQWTGLDPAKVINVGNGVDAIFSPNGSVFTPGFSYFLCVSNRRGHKNEEGLMEAFSKAPIDRSVKLLYTGTSTDALIRLAEQLGISERIQFTGLVPEHDLPGLYRGALALTFPSFYEGFGLPVVEAMACGTPVITSNVSSLPEVAGDAALLVDPSSLTEMSESMSLIERDRSVRKRLSELGLERAQHFSWDAVAERVAVALATAV